MFLVTTESEDDGMWFDEPAGFDTEEAARKSVKDAKDAPPGYCRVLYECHQVDILESGDPRTPAYGVAP